MAKPVILSGMQPSSDSLHLGNYIGALTNWVSMQDEFDAYFCVVDLHAITVPQDPAELRERTRATAAQYIAAGIDPAKSALFIQSHVPAHAQLAWVLNTITGFGEASRMTQFKDKSAKGGTDQASVGLFTYPILMAADILAYQANVVPVGEDQRQHLELTRNLAERFNFHYSPTFTVPEPFIPKVGAKIMSLQEPEKKMSKSDPNERATIFMVDTDDAIRSKVKRAVTDSGTDIVYDEKRAGVANLMTLYSITTGKTTAEIEKEFSGLGYAEFKEAVGEAIVAFLGPVRQRYTELRADEDTLRATLRQGAEAARERARKVLRKVYKKTGFVEL